MPALGGLWFRPGRVVVPRRTWRGVLVGAALGCVAEVSIWSVAGGVFSRVRFWIQVLSGWLSGSGVFGAV